MNLSIGNGTAFPSPVPPAALLATGEVHPDSRRVERALEAMQRARSAFAVLLQAENTIPGYALTEDPTL